VFRFVIAPIASGAIATSIPRGYRGNKSLSLLEMNAFHAPDATFCLGCGTVRDARPRTHQWHSRRT